MLQYYNVTILQCYKVTMFQCYNAIIGDHDCERDREYYVHGL